MRETNTAARATVHATFSVPVILISGADERPLTARLHPREKSIGGDAERVEGIGRAIFWRADLGDVPVKRGDVISVETGEAYHVEITHPHEGETVAAEVTRLDAADAEGLATP